ncbi:hypothetical protein BBP40_011330 [Aspergillus hancockii]|nr:hypothetical protein BBP40_011330 [Aspergillus hancockii]
MPFLVLDATPPQTSGFCPGSLRVANSNTSTTLKLSTVQPYRKMHIDKPIILKGLQTHDDALLAAQHVPLVKAIILSNQGGRSLDPAPPAVHTLLEIHKYCPEVFQKLEVWMDGDVRGTDVVKALCLGAKAVGIGRPALWGLAARGKEGVEQTLQILPDEIKTCMRLLGAKSVKDLG